MIGFELNSVKSGEAVIEFHATKANANPMGTLHGASSATLPTLEWA